MGCGVSFEDGSGAYGQGNGPTREINHRVPRDYCNTRITEAKCEEEQKVVVTR